MNATTEQIERANKVISMGCKLPFEKVLEMEIKKDLRNAPKQMTKKDYEKQAIRNAESNMTSVQCQEFFEQQLQNQKNTIR